MNEYTYQITVVHTIVEQEKIGYVVAETNKETGVTSALAGAVCPSLKDAVCLLEHFLED